MASSKCGVTFWFRYTRVGLPCGIGCVGACAGALGCGEFLDDAGAGSEVGAGVGAGESAKGCGWGAAGWVSGAASVGAVTMGAVGSSGCAVESVISTSVVWSVWPLVWGGVLSEA